MIPVQHEIARGGALSQDSAPVAPSSHNASRPRGLRTYVLHVVPGNEVSVCRRVAKIASRHIADCYIPQCQLPIRVQGEWLLRDSIPFPGYVFLEAEASKLADLKSDLALLTDYNRLLSTDAGVCALSPEEAESVRFIFGPAHYVERSFGVICGDRLYVREGPLKGREDTVLKIDRHKRCAFVKADVLGRPVVRVGLEVPLRV